MYYVYAISSKSRKYIYVGLTNDIDRRFKEYNNGYNKTTRTYKPFILIYSEVFKTRKEVREKEIYLKSGIGKELLKSLIQS